MGTLHCYEVWKRRYGDRATPLAHKVMQNEATRFMEAVTMPRTEDRKRFTSKKIRGNAAWQALEGK